MVKFCPNCGNQMSDNAKFCMECGAKLEDYTSSSSKISDSVIQRSRIGSAGVGSVNISPNIAYSNSENEEDLCPKCGFKMKKSSGNFVGDVIFNGVKIPYSLRIGSDAQSYVCAKCKYKCIFSTTGVNLEVKEIRCICGGDKVYHKGIAHREWMCVKCGRTETQTTFEYEFRDFILPKVLKNEGYDVIL